ncbi:MAG: PocR ligand-binding domain-containing protein [Clostridia bacterium]|nr:PocR ligand-binding domain-containing protein [Clostridia bacterium]
MSIEYKTNKMTDITYDFFSATGINLSILDSNFSTLQYTDKASANEYCKYINSNFAMSSKCLICDYALLKECKEKKQPVSHICHAGLLDIAIPIIHNQSILGYILLGQLKVDENFLNVKNSLAVNDLDINKLEVLYSTLPIKNDSFIKSIINLATILAKHLLLENIVKPTNPSTLDTLVSFINDNIHAPLSVEYIAQQNFVSVSLVYKLFYKNFNTTVKDYINKKRCELSLTLLMFSDKSLNDIAFEVGFSSLSYFSKVFKKLYGVSPLKYRQLS